MSPMVLTIVLLNLLLQTANAEFSKSNLSNKNLGVSRKFSLNGIVSKSELRVLARDFQPFIYKRGLFEANNGIELKIIKSIGEKANLDVIIEFEDQIDSSNDTSMLFK